MKSNVKKTREPLFHLVKRTNVPGWQAWAIRLGTMFGAFILIGLITLMALKVNPIDTYAGMFRGTFFASQGATGAKAVESAHSNRMMLLYNISLLLLVALAVTPAFKMKFWNIGAEGQVLMGALVCMMCMHYFGGKIGNVPLIFISLALSLAAGTLWAVIPALFKAKWNTNETLFTLMMNYVASGLIIFIIKVWEPLGTGSLNPSPFGHLPEIAGENYWITIIAALALTAFMFVYLRYSKHGYEISVVGESENTARYVGINVKKVIVRTLFLSGLICGLVGFLQVAGFDYTVSDSTAGGRGFTAILVSWLAKFNPLVMIFTAFLVVFLELGMNNVTTENQINNNFFSGIATGIMFLMIIACEFFISYKIVFRHQAVKATAPVAVGASKGQAAAEAQEEPAESQEEESVEAEQASAQEPEREAPSEESAPSEEAAPTEMTSEQEAETGASDEAAAKEE